WPRSLSIGHARRPGPPAEASWLPSLAQALGQPATNPAMVGIGPGKGIGGNEMSKAVWMLLLLVAASLESGGDALVRMWLHGSAIAQRLGFFACGAAVLFTYGVVVNLPPWDFGRLLGVYVALFFLVPQIINWLVFGVAPAPRILVGGLLIVAGAMVITFWQNG